MTEEQVLASIDRIVDVLAPKYKFGYFTLDDIKQEGRLAGLKGLEKYNEALPLDNFMFIHIKNRLSNFKRDNFRRNDPPCQHCHNEVKHEHTKACDKHARWAKANASKTRVASPYSLLDSDTEKYTYESSTDFQELSQLIDDALPALLRSAYLKMRAGDKTVTAEEKRQVEDIVRVIAEKFYGQG